MDILRSLPIGLYLEQPITWLHRLDPRIKLFALLTFLLSPIQANQAWRISMVGILIVLTLSTRVPWRVWKQQMGLLLLLASMTLLIATFSPDGLNVNPQPRRPSIDSIALASPIKPIASQASPTPAPEVQPAPAPTLPQPNPYKYVLWKAGGLQVTRRSLDLGIRVSTLIFTFLYSPTLFLLVTSPEEITAGITALTLPLRRFRIPIVEITLTLTLALRFVPLVLEEVQNLVRAIRTRAINWKRLGFKRSTQIWLLLSERLIDNLFIRADQTASAMQIRGFTTPNTHQVRWNPLKLVFRDVLTALILLLAWGVRLWLAGEG
ncbi:energy-coupling factor transporter transmembrane protein EcfT [Tumidithrix elongata RA019]|uniref:Energy-coupling factor transporter transmembrane protein EcfT n=1 Tax=Tumidithrix elongata BACA0141 TaxID=2716417 RepID=A0AAW9PNZ4_9CYAN|nr:energy-coupling factor transporter transmembrane protein EcfT [Tumidithrix elongata RA019]